MKTILQSTEIAYNAITIQDAIVMMPVMDNLCNQRIRAIRTIKDDETRKANGEKVWHDEDHVNELIKIEDQIRIMLKLGFCPSSPAMLQEFNMGEE